MKEFEKKTPSREPSPEGMKGLSKFLPMSDSNYRRRLTEYEVQVQDLQAYVHSLEAETGRLRKKLEDAGVSEVVIETARGFGYRLVDATRGVRSAESAAS